MSEQFKILYSSFAPPKKDGNSNGIGVGLRRAVGQDKQGLDFPELMEINPREKS